MDIKDIGAAMIRQHIILGGKSSIFMTTKGFIIVDALICR